MVASSSHCTKFTQTTLMNCRQLKHTTTLWEDVLRRHGKLKFVNNGDLNDKSRTRKNQLRVELKVGLRNCQQMKAYNDALEHKEAYGIANRLVCFEEFEDISAVETDAHHNIYETSPCIFAPPAIYVVLGISLDSWCRVLSAIFAFMDTKSVFVLVECFKRKSREAELYQVSQANNKELTVSPVRSFGNHRKGDAYSWTLPSQQHRLTSHWFKGKLYMLMPVWELGRGTSTKCKGRTFDPHHKLMGKFKAPDSLTAWGALISAYGNLYYHADTTIHLNKFPSPFQCYNPGSDTWEDLPRIHPDLTRWCDSITGYAVCGGHILVSFGNTFFAYHVRDKKWHRVRYPDGYPGFHGRAVVAGDYIYAVESMSGPVSEFYFDCTNYTLSKPVWLRGLKVSDYDSPSYGNLVSLGNNVYCFVQCGVKAGDCLSLAGDCQSLVITTFNIVGKPGKPGSRRIDTLKVHVYDVEYTRGAGFIYYLSFTFTPDYPCSESEGKDPMVKRDADCRRPTDGQRERERDAKGLEGRGKGHSSGGRGKGHSRRSRRKGLS